jgi:hypothetical protein
MLPEIRRRVTLEFCRVKRDELEEILAEAANYALILFYYLAERGKADIVNAKLLADSAIDHVRAARQVSTDNRF